MTKKEVVKKKKKKSMMPKIVTIFGIVIVMIIGYCLLFPNDIKKLFSPDEPEMNEKSPAKEEEPEEEKLEYVPTGDQKLDDAMVALIDSDVDREAVKTIMEDVEAYPYDLILMLSRNADMTDFVLGYPKYKGTVSAGSIDSFKKGETPLLLQYDKRWGYGMYGDEIIAQNGCGPTAIAMVYAGLTGENTLTPYEVATYSYDAGYYDFNAGTSWLLMTDGAKHFGLKGESMPMTKQAILSALNSGKLIICSMAPGDFTTVGHFIVLTGVKDGKIIVNDPNSTVRSNQLWDCDHLISQMKNLWSYELDA